MTLPQHPLAFDPYRWLRYGLGVSMFLLLEAAWTSPWLANYFASCERLSQGFWLTFLSLSGGIAIAITWLIQARVHEATRRRVYGLAAIGAWLALSLALTQDVACVGPEPAAGDRGFALLLLQVPSEFALFLGVFWTWRQAVPLAGSDGLNPASAGARLQRAVLGLAAYLLAFRPELSSGLLASIALTIGCGLVGGALARASYLGQLRAAARLPFRGRWLLTLLAVFLLVLAVSAILAAAMVRPSVFRASGAALAAVAKIMIAIIAVIARLMIGLAAALVGLFQVEAPSGAQVVPASTALPPVTPIPSNPSPAIHYLAAVGQQLELILSLLILGLMAYYAIRGMGGMGLAGQLGEGDGFGAATPEGDSQQALQPGRIRQAWDDLRRRAARAVAARRATGSGLRGLYLQLLAMASEHGRRRRPAETPGELVRPLVELFRGGEEQIQALTQAFQEARYGGIPDSPERLRAAQQALAGLQAHTEGIRRGRP